MSHKTLPYLTCLKTTINNLAALAGTETTTVTQAAIADGLVDYMMVQRTDAENFRAQSYAEMLALLPAVKAMIGGSDVGHAVNELQLICESADVTDFDRFLQLTSDMQAALFALATPQASALCKSVMQVEATYLDRFQAAVKARAAAAKAKPASTARNDRAYDEKALQAFIRKSFPDEPDVTIEKSGFISGGFSKFTIGITLGNVKLLPKEIVLRGDASATFGGASVVDEFSVVKALYDNGVRVARPLALETTGKIFGSPFLLAERRPGVVLGHTFNLPKPNKAVCIDVATQLAKAHQVPLSALGSSFGSAHPTSSSKAISWVDEGYNNWLPLNMPSPVFKTAFEWLRRNAPITDKVPRALTHGDYSLANVLVHEDKVSIILDWEFAHIGNPVYDLCYHRYQAEALGSWDDFLAAYVKAGMPMPSEEQLNYNTLLADVRLGVMVCQVAKAFTSGAEPNTATASVLAQLSYETTIDRIASTLNKVL